MNVVTLQSDKELESPQIPIREDRREVNSEDSVATKVPIETPSKRVHTEKPKEVQAGNVSPPIKPYKLPIPYP